MLLLRRLRGVLLHRILRCLLVYLLLLGHYGDGSLFVDYPDSLSLFIDDEGCIHLLSVGQKYSKKCDKKNYVLHARKNNFFYTKGNALFMKNEKASTDA